MLATYLFAYFCAHLILPFTHQLEPDQHYGPEEYTFSCTAVCANQGPSLQSEWIRHKYRRPNGYHRNPFLEILLDSQLIQYRPRSTSAPRSFQSCKSDRIYEYPRSPDTFCDFGMDVVTPPYTVATQSLVLPSTMILLIAQS